MIQINRKSKRTSKDLLFYQVQETASHKDKERLRHQNHVHLLNEVMKFVPIPSQQVKTKVKKMRQLVLYTHYLKMIHEQLMKKYKSNTNEDKACVEKISKSISEEAVYERKRKKKSANIIFLHADKSAHKSVCNTDDVKGGFEEFSFSHRSECQKPDSFLRDVTNYTNLNKENGFPECNTSFQPLLRNHHNISNKEKSDISSKDVFHNEKENIPPISQNSSLRCNGTIGGKIPAKNIDRDSATIYQNTTLPNISEKCILKNSPISNAAVENFILSDEHRRDYFFNSFELCPLQSVSNVCEYQVQGSYQSPVFTNNSFYLGDCFLNTLSVEPPMHNWKCVAENISDSSHFDDSADRMFIDVENPPDENPSYTNLSDSTTCQRAKDNFCDNNATLCCDKRKLPINQSIPIYPDIRNKYIPMFPSNCRVYESSSLGNEYLITPTYELQQSHFSNIYPINLDFNRDADNLSLEYVHSLANGCVESSFVVPSESLYYSPCESNQTGELPLLYSESEFINSTDISESSQTSNKSSFFDEETSHSLSEYFKNC